MKFSGRIAFSMIELLVAILFISFAFLPIYNLFRFGQRGTWSNEKEIIATNYAGDLINFMKELNVTSLDKIFLPDAESKELKMTEQEFKGRLSKIKLAPPVSTVVDPTQFVRSVTVQKFDGRPKSSSVIGTVVGWVKELWNKRVGVQHYLVTVTVDYHKEGMSMGQDIVTLSTLVME
ncbi:MAG: hypothetical protein HQM10_05340 [Candidatus Riflebacteria bacterium]|nr:hypothetical protein [Candidatus Riflebacteria bacterium]